MLFSRRKIRKMLCEKSGHGYNARPQGSQQDMNGSFVKPKFLAIIFSILFYLFLIFEHTFPLSVYEDYYFAQRDPEFYLTSNSVIKFEVFQEEILPILLQQQHEHQQFLENRKYRNKLNSFAAKTPIFPQSEYEALELLYNSTNGESWHWFNISGGWNFPNSTNALPTYISNFTTDTIPWNFTSYKENNPCTDKWQGIVCAMTPTEYHVTQIDLSHHNITGTIPQGFGNLPELIALSLRKNFLNGTLPSSMSTLSKLRILNLESNYFTGPLDNWFSNLTNLIYLGVSINFFNSISPGFYSLSQMLFLDIGINNFGGKIPTRFGEYFPLLRETLIGGNYFSGTIPSSFSLMKDLRGFDADINDLNGSFPLVFCTFMNMTGLSLGNNRFTGSIPENITNLKLMNRFFIARNNFWGPIPASIGNWSTIDFFNLNFNLMSGSLPDSFATLYTMRSLLLYDNAFTGTLSSQNFPLRGPLALLYLQYNYFEGPVEDVFSKINTLYYFVATSNQFTGSLPKTFWPILYEYFLGQNYFTGTIPTGLLENSTNLRFIYINSNHLSGTIPSRLVQSPHIANINVSNNALTGTLPDSFGHLLNLDQLCVDNNHLTGTIPESYGNLHQIVVFSLAKNSFTGTIPSSLRHYRVLQEIFLQHNFFTGNIEQVINITNQPFIVNVDITDNLFTGTLPPQYFLENAHTLRTFSASLNCLSGTIPAEICQVDSLQVLSLDGLTTAENCREYIFPALATSSVVTTFLSKRSFYQVIPTCLFSMPNLQSLHLSGNGLTGSLSNNLTIATNLSDLSLSHNSLTGTIPWNIQHRPWMNLDLSYNKLTGTLVNDFGHIPASNGSLYLAVNRLSGRIPVYLLNLETINILNGNLFDCDNANMKELPSHDPQAENYNCGSNAADYAMYAWCSIGSATMLVLLILILRWRRTMIAARPPSTSGTSSPKIPQRIAFQEGTSHEMSPPTCSESSSSSSASREEQKKETLWNHLKTTYLILQSWRAIYSQRPKSSNLYFLQTYFQQVRWIFIKIALFCVLILLPCYIALSMYYSVYTFQYAWTLSGLFFQGMTPAITLLILFAIFIFWIVSLLRDLIRSIEFHRIHHQGRYSIVLNRIVLTGYDRLIYGFIGFVDICIMGIIDVAYVYVALNAASDIIILTALTLAACRILNNQLLLWHFLPWCRYQVFLYQQRQQQLLYDLEQEQLAKEHKLSEAEASKKLVAEEELNRKTSLATSIDTNQMNMVETATALRLQTQKSIINPLHPASSQARSKSRGETLSLAMSSSATVANESLEARSRQMSWYSSFPSPSFFRKSSIPTTTPISAGPSQPHSHERPISVSNWFSFSQTLSPAARFIATYQYTSSDIKFLERIMLLNNIILPVLAILFVSSDCFYNVLFQAPAVTASYLYITCPRYFGDGNIALQCSNALETTTYSPPFVYRYQCSSEIVVNYIPVYCWMFIFIGFLLPLSKLLAKRLYDWLTPYYQQARKRERLLSSSDLPRKNDRRNRTSSPVETIKTPEDHSPQQRQQQRLPFSTICLLYTYYCLQTILPEHLKELRPKSPFAEETTNASLSVDRIEEGGEGGNRKRSSSTLPVEKDQRSLDNPVSGDLEGGEGAGGGGRARATTLRSTKSSRSTSSVIKATNGFLFKKLKLGVQINSYLTIVLAFGVLFPPLAIIACLAVISVTTFEEFALGRLLTLAKQAGYHWYEERLEQECDGAADALVLSYEWMICMACGLYAYILFDSWGDAAGWRSAVVPAVVMGSLPLFVYLYDRFIQAQKRKTYQLRLESIEELFHIQLSERSNLRITESSTRNVADRSDSDEEFGGRKENEREEDHDAAEADSFEKGVKLVELRKASAIEREGSANIIEKERNSKEKEKIEVEEVSINRQEKV